MSLHGITKPRTKVHEIREISFDWPDPNVAKFRCALTNSMPDISAVTKISPPEKVGQSSSNSGSQARYTLPVNTARESCTRVVCTELDGGGTDCNQIARHERVSYTVCNKAIFLLLPCFPLTIYTSTSYKSAFTIVCGDVTRRPASADRTARRQFQAGLRGDVGL